MADSREMAVEQQQRQLEISAWKIVSKLQLGHNNVCPYNLSMSNSRVDAERLGPVNNDDYILESELHIKKWR